MSYNGWKNYETWNVALWIGNDPVLYGMALNAKNYIELATALREAGVLETQDAVAFNDSGLDIKALDEMMRELR